MSQTGGTSVGLPSAASTNRWREGRACESPIAPEVSIRPLGGSTSRPSLRRRRDLLSRPSSESSANGMPGTRGPIAVFDAFHPAPPYNPPRLMALFPSSLATATAIGYVALVCYAVSTGFYVAYLRRPRPMLGWTATGLAAAGAVLNLEP